MITSELLELAEPLFQEIDKAIIAKDWPKVFILLDYPQPEQWIKRGKSDFFPGQEYEYNEIELLEAVLDRISEGWDVHIKSTNIVQDKGKFAVTTHVEIQIDMPNDFFYYEGIATTFAESIQHLTLATPKSVTDAVKNACKRIGRLLGRDLNRGIEDLPVIQVANNEVTDEKEWLQFLDSLRHIQTQEDAVEFVKRGPFKHLYPNNVDINKIIEEKIPF